MVERDAKRYKGAPTRKVDIGDTTYQIESATNRLRPLLKNGEVGPEVGFWSPETDQYTIDQETVGGEWVDEVVNGDIPLPQHIGDESPAPASVRVTAETCSQLDSGEVVVLEEFVEDLTLIDEARDELEEIYQEHQSPMQQANHGQASSVRNDHIAFFKTRWDDGADGPDGPNLIPSESLQQLYSMIENLAYEMNQIAGKNILLTPPLGMGSVYDAGDAKYIEHLDNDREPSKQNAWRNYRVFTVVLYLNPPDWTEQDGGLLQAKQGSCHKTVVPKGGTAVLFDSRKVLHQVTPAQRRRFAITMWFVAADPENFQFSPKEKQTKATPVLHNIVTTTDSSMKK